MNEGCGRVSQGRDGVMSVPRVLELVRSRTPVEAEEEIKLGGNFPTRYYGGAVCRDSGDGLREACRGRIYFRRGANEP